MAGEEVAILNRKMDRVLSILENDDKTSKPGLVSEVSEIRTIMVNHITRYNMETSEKKGKDKVWRIVYGGIGAFLLWLFKTIGAAIAAVFTHA